MTTALTIIGLVALWTFALAGYTREMVRLYRVWKQAQAVNDATVHQLSGDDDLADAA